MVFKVFNNLPHFEAHLANAIAGLYQNLDLGMFDHAVQALVRYASDDKAAESDDGQRRLAKSLGHLSPPTAQQPPVSSQRG
jgi:hypothetical protein